MSDTSEVFKTLQDQATGDGYAIAKTAAGTAPSLQAIEALVAVDDSTGALAHIRIKNGKLLVDTEASGGDKKFASNLLASPNNSTFQDVVTLDLAASKTAGLVEAKISCTHVMICQLVKYDNAVETVLDEFLAGGAGVILVPLKWENLEFSTGAVGPQSLKIKAKSNTGSQNSTVRASLGAVELA